MKHEVVSSGLSYGTAGGGYVAVKAYEATLGSFADAAHDITLIIVCGIVTVRFIYDAVRLFRYLKKK